MGRVFAAVSLDEFTQITKFRTFGDLTNVIVRNAFVIAGVISFILLIFGGFSIIVGAGSGDTKKIEQGQQSMVGAVVGLIVVIGSLWIVQIIETITGIPILNPK